MKRVVILGSSLASKHIIKCLREESYDGQITLILYDEFLPSSRWNANLSFQHSDNFYEEYKVEIFFNAYVSRINLNRKKIYFEDKNVEDKKTQIDFDYLIITETPENRFPDIKGIHKKGVLGLHKLEDLNTLKESAQFKDSIVIASDNLKGFLFVASLSHGKSDIVLVQSSKGFFNKLFNEEEKQWFIKELEQRKIRLELNNSIAEILGDGELCAVRLNSGKVFACDLAVFDELNEDLRLFQPSELSSETEVFVDNFFNTSVENVFAVDKVCAKKGSSSKPLISDDFLVYQACIVSKQIIAKEKQSAFEGQNFDSSSSVVYHAAQISSDFSIAFLGDIENSKLNLISKEFLPQELSILKIFGFDDFPVAGILINRQKDLDKFLQVVQKKDTLLSGNSTV